MPKKIILKVNIFGLCENAYFPWQPIMQFSKIGVYHISVATYHMLDYLTLRRSKAYTQVFNPMVINAYNLFCIFAYS